MASKAMQKNVKNAQVDLKDNMEKIKTTANKLSNEIVETANELTEDLKTTGVQIKDEAVKTVKATIEKARKPLNVKEIRKQVAATNDFLVKTADEVLDTTLENATKWNTVAQKAIKGGLQLVAKQQDMLFDTLETVKEQWTQSGKRVRKLVK